VSRPCPYVGCRYHLLLNVRADGVLEMNGAKGRQGAKAALDVREDERALWAVEWIDTAVSRLFALPETCAIDVAEQGMHSPRKVGELMAITKRRVSQIEAGARAKIEEGASDA